VLLLRVVHAIVALRQLRKTCPSVHLECSTHCRPAIERRRRINTALGHRSGLPPALLLTSESLLNQAKHLAKAGHDVHNKPAMADKAEYEYLPPPGPPPMLSLEQLRHLCRYGWLAYDLSPDLSDRLTRLFGLASNFFNQGTEEKQRLYPASQGTECGYYCVEAEKEYVTLRRQVHQHLPFEAEAGEAWREIAQLLHGVLLELSKAEGLETSVWDDMVNGSLPYPPPDADLNNVISLMRVFRYLPTTGVADPHTDLGVLTLCVGDGTGLEVLDTSLSPPEWRPAAKATILVGETLRKLSNGVIRAGLHRVVGNPEGRGSIVFALRPNLSERVDLSAFGGEGVVDTRKFYMDIKGTKYNINANHELREAQRQGREAANGMG